MSTKLSNDRRARRTRAALQTALLALLQKRRLESIQIKEITDLADVSRPAFYLHFESKEELLLSHIDDLFAQLHKAVFADLAQRQPVTLETLVMTSFQLWGKEAKAWQVALQIENKDLLLIRLRRHMAALMDEFAAYPGSNITQHPIMHDYIVGLYDIAPLGRGTHEDARRTDRAVGLSIGGEHGVLGVTMPLLWCTGHGKGVLPTKIATSYLRFVFLSLVFQPTSLSKARGDCRRHSPWCYTEWV